jgi:hypothetical protein
LAIEYSTMPIPPAAVAALGAGIIGGTTTAIRTVKTYRAAKRRGLSTRRAIGEAGDVAIRGAATTLAGAAATGLGVKFAGDLLTGAAEQVGKYSHLRTAEEPPEAFARPPGPQRRPPSSRVVSRATERALRGMFTRQPPEVPPRVAVPQQYRMSQAEINAVERSFSQAMEGDDLPDESGLSNMLAGYNERKRPALPAEAPALPAGMSLQEVALQGGMPGTVAPGIVVQPRQLADLSRPPQYRAIGHAGTPQVYQPLEADEMLTISPEAKAALERARMARYTRLMEEGYAKFRRATRGAYDEETQTEGAGTREAATSYEKPPAARVRGAAAKSAAGQQQGAVKKVAVKKEAKAIAREIAEKAIQEIEKKRG